MRRIHRWLSVVFGLFILWIAVTGVLSQVGELVNNGGFEAETAERGNRPTAALGEATLPPAPVPLVTATPAQSAAFVCPADMSCKPKKAAKPGDWDVGYLHHLHSGEEFGPAGVILSLVSGLALIFFALSGMWMYVMMYRRRARRHSHPRRIFW